MFSISKKTVLKKILTFLPSIILIVISVLFSFKLWHSVFASNLWPPETPPITAPETSPETPPGVTLGAPYPTVSDGVYYSSISTWLNTYPGTFHTYYTHDIVGEDSYGLTTEYTGNPITINYSPGSTVKLSAISFDGVGMYSNISETYYVFSNTPVSIDINNISSLVDNLAFSYIDTGEDNPDVQVNVDITFTVPNSLGTTNTVVLPEFTRITRADGALFEPLTLTASDVSLSAISGLSDSASIEGAFQWGVLNQGLIFSSPITLNIYVGSDLNNQTLNVVRSIDGATGWTTDGIVSPGTCVVNNGYCQFQATKASYYVASRQVSTNSNSSSSNPIPNGPPDPYYCGDSKPSLKPDLFQIDVTGNTAKLFFTPLKDTSEFYVSFSSVNKNAEEHGGRAGLSRREGVQSYIVYQLRPSTTYYFKVRGQNGCMPGDWSNILKVKTTSGKSTIKKYFANSFSSFSNSIKSVVKKIKPTTTTKPKVILPNYSNSLSPVDKIISPLSEPTAYPTTKPEPIVPTSTPRIYNTQPTQSPVVTPMPKKKCFLWWCW